MRSVPGRHQVDRTNWRNPDMKVQSGERFEGVENLREWRSNYPASTKVEFREIRGGGDVWVAELSISYDDGPWLRRQHPRVPWGQDRA
jgi:hypothetical protein